MRAPRPPAASSRPAVRGRFAMNAAQPPRGAGAPDGAFSPVDNELPLRWFRRLRIVPAGELGTGRRAVLLALLTWVPIVAWAAIAGRLLQVDAGEPLLQHYGVHVRCLLAIPLLVLAEAALHRAAQPLAAQFVSSGIVGADQRAGSDLAIRN